MPASEPSVEKEDMEKDGPAASTEPETDPSGEVKKGFDRDDLAGVWTITTIGMDGVTLPASIANISATLEFSADGTAILNYEGETKSTEYTISGYEVTLIDNTGDGENDVGVYDPETDTLRFENLDGAMFVMERASKVKEAETKTPEPTAAPDEPVMPDEPAKEFNPEDLVDVWAITEVVVGELSVPASSAGLDATIELRADGTAIMTSDGESSTARYTVSGYDVTLIEESGTETMPGKYDPEKDQIIFEQEEGKIVMERASKVTDPVVEAPEKVDPTDADLIGAWTLTKAKSSGIEVPVSMLNGLEMGFEFREDGTAAMTSSELSEPLEGLNWTVTDGVIALSAYGQQVTELTYDGTVLILTQTSVDLIFEKQN